MSEPSPFASLGASLLARKGAARPAMRPQTQPILGASGGMDTLEDLGWNDMGDEPVVKSSIPLPLTPASSYDDEDDDSHAGYGEIVEGDEGYEGDEDYGIPEVRRQQEAIAQQIAPVESTPVVHAQAPGSPLMTKKQALDLPPPVSTYADDEEDYAEEEAFHVEPPKVAAKVTSLESARSRRARKSALESGRKAAFTLRLDSERHLKLRLACTLRNRSAQQIVTEALDLLLGQMPEVDSLASQVKRH